MLSLRTNVTKRLGSILQETSKLGARKRQKHASRAFSSNSGRVGGKGAISKHSSGAMNSF